MSLWPASFVLGALEAVPPPGLPSEFSEISTDTRALHQGALFVALAGERFDGHAYLPQARDGGAAAAVVRQGTPPVEGLPLLEVEDTLAAYGRLALAHRRRIAGPVVAIGGSNGKTSTKEMVAAVLRTRWRTQSTPANDNNLVGIPKTILAAPAGTEALAIEAGANTPGELARARMIIEPTMTVTTNVADSHLEGFGSFEGILQEELELVDGSPLAIVGTEPPALAESARHCARRVVTAGLAGADLVPERVTLDQRGEPTVRVDGLEFHLPLRGEHQAGNAMLAWAVARELGLDRAAAARALSALVIPGGRGELLQFGPLTVLHDGYNANPHSFYAAIRTAGALRSGRRLVFLAGTMRELGADAPRLHAEVARALVDLEPELLGAVGDFVPALAPYAARLGDRLVTGADVTQLGERLKPRLRGDELVVLKASRGVALERILPYLTALAARPPLSH